MSSLLDKRLARLEQAHTTETPSRDREKFYVAGYGHGDGSEFLLACGHDVRDGDIIRQIVGAAPQGGPLVEPFSDRTAEMRSQMRL